jgi:hypothetical protein
MMSTIRTMSNRFEIAARSLNDQEKLFFFMTELETLVTAYLSAMGCNPIKYTELLRQRYAEYLGYRKWVADENESVSGTLFWEFSKRLREALGIGINPLFNVQLTALMLKHIRRWNLSALLKG